MIVLQLFSLKHQRCLFLLSFRLPSCFDGSASFHSWLSTRVDFLNFTVIFKVSLGWFCTWGNTDQGWALVFISYDCYLQLLGKQYVRVTESRSLLPCCLETRSCLSLSVCPPSHLCLPASLIPLQKCNTFLCSLYSSGCINVVIVSYL